VASEPDFEDEALRACDFMAGDYNPVVKALRDIYRRGREAGAAEAFKQAALDARKAKEIWSDECEHETNTANEVCDYVAESILLSARTWARRVPKSDTPPAPQSLPAPSTPEAGTVRCAECETVYPLIRYCVCGGLVAPVAAPSTPEADSAGNCVRCDRPATSGWHCDEHGAPGRDRGEDTAGGAETEWHAEYECVMCGHSGHFVVLGERRCPCGATMHRGHTYKPEQPQPARNCDKCRLNLDVCRCDFPRIDQILAEARDEQPQPAPKCCSPDRKTCGACDKGLLECRCDNFVHRVDYDGSESRPAPRSTLRERAEKAAKVVTRLHGYGLAGVSDDAVVADEKVVADAIESEARAFAELALRPYITKDEIAAALEAAERGEE
jgi:hypothetical protein